MDIKPKQQSVGQFTLICHTSDFELYEHQADTLQRINTERAKGKSTFLVVLPTGTGKTEVFIEDMRLQYQAKQIEKVLVIVPTRELKNQMLGRVKHHLPKLIVGHDFNDKNTDIIIQTSAYTLRHYIHQDASYFDYILVDEAHRAAAHGLRKVLEHFNPKTLVGLTATDERLDKQKLEDIFGSYQVDLTLEQAIEKGIAPPIRAFRLSSNIDLSKVRFNGKDFVKSDLNKTVQVPSRDQLIVDVLVKYFKAPLLENKLLSQGIIFCVDVKHTKRMAALLNKHDLSAASVHGGDRKGVDEYQAGNIRFLCACELLSEGWDAPQTEIVVMARPTMSKVLYTQQLGRGTRKYNGKEALYVIDVVDSYGAAIQPWSLHNLFNINTYMPFANVIEPEHALATDELIQLDGLWEGERRLEPINIFNFEKEYAHLLNDEQLARELFVSTGTIKSWLKKGDIKADKTLPFGNSILNYFAPSKVTDIRVFKGLKERTEASRYDDFFEFLELRDYTFSYKIAFLLSLLKHCDLQGEADLEVVTQTYQSFYLQLLQQFGKTEKDNNPLNDIAKLDDVKYMQRSMLQNPFEKFERKRFIYQCQDLALISFDTVLWEKLSADDFKKIQKQYIEDGNNYFAKLDIELNETFFNHIFNKESIINDATQQQADVIPLVIPPAATESQEVNKVEIPFYEDLKIACGHFKNSSAEIVNSYFIEDGFGKISPEKHFVATAKGNSMNGGKFPIVDGDLLLFEWKSAESAGSISNQTLAIELLDETGDPQYLLRRIVKEPPATYILKANNPDYQDKIATEEMRTFARFIRVLKY